MIYWYPPKKVHPALQPQLPVQCRIMLTHYALMFLFWHMLHLVVEAEPKATQHYPEPAITRETRCVILKQMTILTSPQILGAQILCKVLFVSRKFQPGEKANGWKKQIVKTSLRQSRQTCSPACSKPRSAAPALTSTATPTRVLQTANS